MNLAALLLAASSPLLSIYAQDAKSEFSAQRGKALADGVEVGGQHGSDPGGTSAKIGCVNSDVFL